MDSSTLLDSHPAPAAGGAVVIRGARVWKLANDGRGEGLAGGGISLAGQACPVSQGGGDRISIFPEKEPVAVATSPRNGWCHTRQLTAVVEGDTR